MAMNPKSILFFASKDVANMPGDVLVRYVEVRPGALSEVEVKEDAHRNRIYSNWEKDRLKELQALQANLTLQPLFKKPPPAWMHPAVVAGFLRYLKH